MYIGPDSYLHQHPVVCVFHSKNSRGLQRESPARMGHVGVLKGSRTGPQPGQALPSLAHPGAPKPCHKIKVSPAYAIPQPTWETSPGLPSTALVSQATTYKYLMSGAPFIRKYVNKNILWNWDLLQTLKRLIVWGTAGFFFFFSF